MSLNYTERKFQNLHKNRHHKFKKIYFLEVPYFIALYWTSLIKNILLNSCEYNRLFSKIEISFRELIFYSTQPRTKNLLKNNIRCECEESSQVKRTRRFLVYVSVVMPLDGHVSRGHRHRNGWVQGRVLKHTGSRECHARVRRGHLNHFRQRILTKNIKRSKQSSAGQMLETFSRSNSLNCSAVQILWKF